MTTISLFTSAFFKRSASPEGPRSLDFYDEEDEGNEPQNPLLLSTGSASSIGRRLSILFDDPREEGLDPLNNTPTSNGLAYPLGRHTSSLSGRKSKSARFETNAYDAVTPSLLVGGEKAYTPTYRTVVALTVADTRPHDERPGHLAVPSLSFNPSSPAGVASHAPRSPHTPEQPHLLAQADTPQTPHTPQLAHDHQLYIHIPIADQVEHFMLPHIVRHYPDVQRRLALGPTLIHCSQGVSRSVSFLVGTLLSAYYHRQLDEFGAEGLHQNLVEAGSSQDRIRVILDYIRERRPCAGPKPWFIYQLLLLDRAFEKGELVPQVFKTTSKEISELKNTASTLSNTYRTLASIEDDFDHNLHAKKFKTHSGVYEGIILEESL